MDAADLNWLQSADGVRATEDTAALLAAGTTTLRVIDTLRARYPEPYVRAALALADGRAVARDKFPDGDRLFCDRASAEQASSEHAAAWTAVRFAGARRVIDLGCGMGGDALAIARHAPVVAVDRDPARLRMVEANARVRGLTDRVVPLEGDLTTIPVPPDVDGAWLDPSRRDAHGRIRDPQRWSPPLTAALAIASRFTGAAIKLAPGVALDELPVDGEIEFISLAGNLVEAVLWTGRFAGVPRRATVLPDGASIGGTPDGTPDGPPGPPEAFLYDPDPSVGRAGLVAQLAAAHGLRQLDPSIAYLTGTDAITSPFARRFRIDAWLPFAERSLLTRLRGLGVGRVEVMRRGSPVDTNALERRLNRTLARGASASPLVRTVALTRVAGEHVAIVCERERP